MPGRSTIEAIHLVRRLVEQFWERKKNLHMMFIDLEKTYDRISREILRRILKARGVPVAYIKSIQDMYDGSKTHVRIVGGDLEHFPLLIGLHQGSTLSPFLFDLGSGETDENVTHCIGVGWLKWRLALGVLYDKKVSPKLKGKFYRVVVHLALLYEAECWPGEERDYSGEGEGGFGGEQDARSAVILVQHVMRRGSDVPVRKCDTLTIDGFRRALRRYQATHRLECFVGPLGISSQPSEREFVSCLRSDFVFCNLINKVQPGSVPKCCRACIKKGKRNHWTLVVIQEKELSNLKVLLASTKREFENLQSQLQSDLKQLGDQVLDMSNAALGYHKFMKENRTLHNMVQDLKEAKTVVDFIGEDGSLVVIDPLKPWKDGRKIFEFHRVFGSSATQGRSCMNGNGLPLPDASVHPVNCARDVIHLMKLGDVNRAVGSTAMNNRSSRSHSVLTVHVHGEDTSGNIIHSCLHLVDLAGGERVDKLEVTGDGLKEAQHINKSLSCLGDVITALAQKNSHIPYRNSKLTLLLQNSLGGHAKTLMFAHVSPEGDSFGETISTLKFAQRVSSVELGAARLNKESVEVLELKAEIETLKKALANKEAQTPQKEASRTPFQKPNATAELQEGYDITKLYDQAGNDSFMKTPPSPPFAFRSQDTPQTPASGLKYQQAPWSPTSCNKSQQPPRSPTSDFKSQQLPRSPTSALKSCNAPRSPTSAAIQSQKPLTSSTHGKGCQIRRSLRTIGKLINGSDRKNQQKRTGPAAPLSPFSCQNEEKSSTASNARTLRR
ncbi:Kinesin KP1 [Capsicum baccatum]|uniref:Kinesin KP1 n=1 Tax=Capsicum baccatum TaxID=33114 RepID=A0A2G2UXJ1_CAPBA|nr:Kinesin KP1 [Capsicum baccatum]